MYTDWFFVCKYVVGNCYIETSVPSDSWLLSNITSSERLLNCAALNKILWKNMSVSLCAEQWKVWIFIGMPRDGKHSENVSQRGFLFVHMCLYRPFFLMIGQIAMPKLFFFSSLKTLSWSFSLFSVYLFYLAVFVQSRCLFSSYFNFFCVTALICEQTCPAQTPRTTDFLIFCLFVLKTKGHERIFF